MRRRSGLRGCGRGRRCSTVTALSQRCHSPRLGIAGDERTRLDPPSHRWGDDRAGAKRRRPGRDGAHPRARRRSRRPPASARSPAAAATAAGRGAAGADRARRLLVGLPRLQQADTRAGRGARALGRQRAARERPAHRRARRRRAHDGGARARARAGRAARAHAQRGRPDGRTAAARGARRTRGRDGGVHARAAGAARARRPARPGRPRHRAGDLRQRQRPSAHQGDRARAGGALGRRRAERDRQRLRLDSGHPRAARSIARQRARTRQLGRQTRPVARERCRPRGADPGRKRKTVSEQKPAVVLALTPVAERAIEPLLFGPQALVEPHASVGEADELDHELGPNTEAVLLSPDLSGLTAAHCVRARARGARLVGIALDEDDRQALGALAVDDTVDAAAGADALRRALRAASAPASAAPASVTAPAPAPRAGSVVAVIGSKGAPGASECAASLAALASKRWTALLVELDALGGALDLRLAADAHQGSLLGVARAADAGDSALRELLERWLATRDGWPPVLLGPATLTQALPELARPGVVANALNALAQVTPLSVLDVGFQLEQGDDVGPT